MFVKEDTSQEEMFALFCNKNGYWVYGLCNSYLQFSNDLLQPRFLMSASLSRLKGLLTSSLKSRSDPYVTIDGKEQHLTTEEFKCLILSCEIRKISVSKKTITQIDVGDTVFLKVFDPKLDY